MSLILFVGPRKTGTTWIDALLRADTRVWLPAVKETFFFDEEFHRGIDWYLAQFDGANGQDDLLVEVAPSYLMSDRAQERICSVDLEVNKMVVTLRHPVDRSISSYFHELKKGRWVVGPEKFFTNDRLERLRYLPALERAMSGQLANRLELLWYDDLQAEPERFAESVQSLLELTPQLLELPGSGARYARSAARWPMLSRVAARSSRAAAQVGLGTVVQRARRSLNPYLRTDDVPQISADMRQMLAEFFAEDVEQIAKLTGRRFNVTGGAT